MAELVARGGGPKKRFQYCLDPCSAETIPYFRAIQGHSGRKEIGPALQDNVLSPSDFAENIYHVGSSHDMHSIIQSGLIPGRQDIKKGRQTVFFKAVNPMSIHPRKHRDYDVTKPRIAVYKQNWKKQNTVYWANLRVAQEKGLIFYQTRSDAIILHNTLPAVRIEKVVAMSSGEVLQTKKRISSLTAKSCTKTSLARRTNGYCKQWRERESIQSNTHSSKYGTCRGEIDYRIQGLPHCTVEQEDHTRKKAVKKLIHQFETHPNRVALKADLRQNYAYSPFSEKSKDMNRSMGNVEYFDMCEVSPKIQCPHCLTCWTKGIVFVLAELACAMETKRAN